MIRRKLTIAPEHLYPTDEWLIRETRYSEKFFARAETAFSLSNGYLGIRGTFDEGRPSLSPGTFVNGFHETWPIVHAEDAYGLARTGQTIVNVPDATVIRLYVDDEPLFLPTARLRRCERILDMRAGTLTRELRWATAAGKHVTVRSCRMVSLEHRHLAAIRYEVVVDEAAPVVIASQIVNRQDSREIDDVGHRRRAGDPRLAQLFDHRVLESEVAECDGGRMRLGYRAANSGMTLAVCAEHVIDTAGHYYSTAESVEADGGRSELVISVDAQPGIPIRLAKYVSYQTSRGASSHGESPADLVARCDRTLERAVQAGFGALEASQRARLDDFWTRADVRVDVGPESERAQQAIRWNLFQVAQATLRAEGSGVPAKGLTGQAYGGHYFWDTEVYLLPFLTYTHPRLARNQLRFRHSMLKAARARASELGHPGALFPWRTINGEEASAYYQAGTAQYHLNADIAYAIRCYVQAQGDIDFLVETGAEMLIETARLWADLGFHSDDGAFHIHGVTGPDEYTTVVNDNAYTNLMARMNLRYAADTVRRLRVERPGAYMALAAELELGPDEVAEWGRAADAMHVPYDERRGVHPQDASFLDREVWDLKATPLDHFPLLLHYHPLVIYRHQVLKQADVVLAIFMLGDEFDKAAKAANYAYYDRLTSGDSSLSACVQSIVAAEVGNETDALQYFRHALLMDLADAAGNTSDGVHIACAAGVWQALVFGFGGVREYGGRLSITPHLPVVWRSLSFSLCYRESRLHVELSHEGDRYTVEGAPVDVIIAGTEHRLVSDKELALAPATRVA